MVGFGTTAEQMFGTEDASGDLRRLDRRIRDERFKTLSVEFYWRDEFDPEASRESGMPVHVQVPYVKLQHFGERDWTPKPALERSKRIGGTYAGREAYWSYAEIFWEEYEAFIGASKPPTRGLPLNMWGEISTAEAKDIESRTGCRTVEDLAALPDNRVKKLGFGNSHYRDMAREMLKESKDIARDAQQAAKIRELEAKLEALAAGAAPAEAPASDAEPSEAALEAFEGWEDDALAAYITDNGGAVDGRWKSARLKAEAAKLAPEPSK